MPYLSAKHQLISEAEKMLAPALASNYLVCEAALHDDREPYDMVRLRR